MKKLIIIILAFLVIIFVADKLIFYTLSYFYKHTTVGQEGGDIQKYLSDPNPPELVILGSSTTRFQVNPDSFPIPACNLAHTLTTDCYQLALLSLMIQRNKTPKNILLSLWPRNYIISGQKDLQPEDILFLKYYYPENDFIRNQINKISRWEKFKYVFSTYRFNGQALLVLKYYQLSLNADTKYFFFYQVASANDSINTVNGIRQRNAHPASTPAKVSQVQTSFLPAFIDTCKKYGINLMCYYMPQKDEDSVLLKDAIEFMESTLTARHVPYRRFTYSDITNWFNSPAMWSEGVHLNYKGGAIQSHMLSEFVKQHVK